MQNGLTDTPPGSGTIRFRVRYAETDAMGVVHHSRYLPWFEMGRTEFIRERGYTYRALEQMGVLLAVIEVNVRYRASSAYDDPIVLHTQLTELGRVKLRFAYQVYHEESGRLLAEGETLHAFIGRNGAPIRLASQYPEVWARLQALMDPVTPAGQPPPE
ncbi:MAG TPA: thioesterase family protein [Chloroflexia bacterium]|nr:thioesterase family protein [Chloroflexia bacterium]